MKIILSRKGFDESTGEIPSPILPFGRLLSLPIPVTKKGEVGIPYADLRFDVQPISKIINDLRSPRRSQFPYKEAHLDPDLDRDRLKNRGRGWEPAFGQVGPPQTLLENVGDKDLFLFFGWFRRTMYRDGRLCYIRPSKGGRDLHVIFGWLQVDKIFKVGRDKIPNRLEDHLHVRNASAHGYGPTNTIYTAADELTVFGQRFGVRGAGTFPCFKPSLQLTAPEEKSRSHWSLPKWLCREHNHGKWACHLDHLPFDSNGRRQEFVFEIPDNSQHAKQWLKGLFEECS